MLWMPGRSHEGELPPLTTDDHERSERIRRDIHRLAGEIGERNTEKPAELLAAADFIDDRFSTLGYEVHREEFVAGGMTVANIVAEMKGRKRPREIVVIGAHYDSPPGSPGANDNASGIAGLLETARQYQLRRPERTVRCVAFVNEEPPYFKTESMGSLVYARGCRRRREKVVAMLCLECLGCYHDHPGSQSYPPPLERYYPDTADFIAFCSNFRSYPLLRKVVRAFRSTTKFPSQGLVAPERMTGISWSDHWSFWQERYPAIMITDTAFLRNRHYHLASDLPGTIDYGRMARVVGGIGRIVQRLAR